jgi:hypothetical protein
MAINDPQSFQWKVEAKRLEEFKTALAARAR